MNTCIDQFAQIFTTKKKIMVVMAHPDDSEIMAGGTISRLTAAGKEVCVVKVTRGGKGSRQEVITEETLEKIRISEDNHSMEILRIKPENRIFLDIPDGNVDNSLETIGKIALQIRLFKPELIITHNPEDVIVKFDAENSWINHRDHRNTALSTIDAAYPFSRDLLFFPEHFQIAGAESHSVTEFLLVDYYNHEDTICIDVTGFTQKRTDETASHASQFDRKRAESFTEFFTNSNSDKNYEKFRYVKVD
ncbi:PIG-L family deacetylase [bacterium]|nr:PIG-L family deacetylase [bacterium]